MKASARVVNMDKAEPLQGGSDAFSKVPSPRDHFSHLRGVAAKFSAPLRVAAPCAGTGNAIRAAFEIFGEENVIPMHVFDTDKHLAGPVGWFGNNNRFNVSTSMCVWWVLYTGQRTTTHADLHVVGTCSSNATAIITELRFQHDQIFLPRVGNVCSSIALFIWAVMFMCISNCLQQTHHRARAFTWLEALHYRAEGTVADIYIYIYTHTHIHPPRIYHSSVGLEHTSSSHMFATCCVHAPKGGMKLAVSRWIIVSARTYL